jgi:hypothetical protein
VAIMRSPRSRSWVTRFVQGRPKQVREAFLELPTRGQPVTELEHFGAVVARVDMPNRARDQRIRMLPLLEGESLRVCGGKEQQVARTR